MATHPLRPIYSGMLDRCHNPRNRDYARYGGRGIHVCQRWRDSFAAFVEDMGERPSPQHQIDRADNDGNYEPGNCRWSTPLEQSRNRGNTVWYEFRGERKTLSEWADITGIPYTTLYNRIILNKWPAESAFKASKATGKPTVKPCLSVKAGPKWTAWLTQQAALERVTAVRFVEMALVAYAEHIGFDPPPPRLG